MSPSPDVGEVWKRPLGVLSNCVPTIVSVQASQPVAGVRAFSCAMRALPGTNKAPSLPTESRGHLFFHLKEQRLTRGKQRTSQSRNGGTWGRVLTGFR